MRNALIFLDENFTSNRFLIISNLNEFILKAVSAGGSASGL